MPLEKVLYIFFYNLIIFLEFRKKVKTWWQFSTIVEEFNVSVEYIIHLWVVYFQIPLSLFLLCRSTSAYIFLFDSRRLSACLSIQCDWCTCFLYNLTSVFDVMLQLAHPTSLLFSFCCLKVTYLLFYPVPSVYCNICGFPLHVIWIRLRN